MSHRRPVRTSRSRTRSILLALLVVAALLGLVGCRSPSASREASGEAGGGHRHGIGIADGELPDGVTVFDDTYPGVANLNPALRSALRTAARDAEGDGVVLYVDSGWRSPAYQEQLLEEAVATYGSPAAAARWVATPATSAHVSGAAVDIGHAAATTWLSEHGSAYGLCQIYRNEPWHYELRPAAATSGCPPPYADPTQDPRMRQ